MDRIVRLDPALQVAELTEQPPLPPHILDGDLSPRIVSHPYLKDLDSHISVGIWTATPFAARLRHYGTHEFMLLIEGELTLIGADGIETIIVAPEAVVIPKGLPCRWSQTTNVRKFYMTLAGDSLSSTIAKPVRVERNGALTPVPVGPDGTVRAARVDYADPSGRFRVGQWASAAFKTPTVRHAKFELMHLLEGSVTLTEPARPSQTFTAGDTVLIPHGTELAWECTNYVRKLFCTFAPVPVRGDASVAVAPL